ncbi:hypothetical protein ESNG_03473 [Escherichia coli B093]|nr:hypothetical protein ESNG_03473 [Escherichia coli B093]
MGVTDEQPEQKRPFTLVALVAFVPVYLVQVGLLYLRFLSVVRGCFSRTPHRYHISRLPVQVRYYPYRGTQLICRHDLL